MVNEWISWCQTKWLPIMHGPLLPVLGFSKNFDQKAYSEALAAAKKVAKELDDHLKHAELSSEQHWIVYDKISLADIYLGVCFTACFQTIFDAGVRNAFPHLSKWFERYTHHHSVIENFGVIKMCTKAIKPSAVSPGSAPAPAPAKEAAQAPA